MLRGFLYWSAFLQLGSVVWASGSRKSWPRSLLLNPDSKFTFSWDPQPDEEGRLHMALSARTRGYIGFGLSDTGTMAGADLIIAWPLPSPVTNTSNQVAFMDLYAAQNGLPTKDSTTHWQLERSFWKPENSREGELKGDEGWGMLEIQVSRPLDTGDPEDMPITRGGIYILFAWGNAREIEYHSGRQRGARWLKLLEKATNSRSADVHATRYFTAFFFTLLPLLIYSFF